MNGFRTELVEKILGFNAHVIVQPHEKKINKENLNKLDYLSNQIIKTNFSYNGEGILISEFLTKGVVIRGYLKNEIKKLKLISDGVVDGSLDKFNKDSISIGKELAISANLMVGDQVTIMSSSKIQTPFGNIPKQEDFIISSIFDTEYLEFNQNVIFVPLESVISLFDVTENDFVLEIFLKNPEKIELIQPEIQKLFPNHFVYSWTDLNKPLFMALKIERNVMFIILTLIIVVAAFNIISGLTILVKNKTKEIAILRTLGVSRKSITKIFIITGFIIGFFATITGVIIGVLFSIYVEEIRKTISLIFNIKLFPEEVYFLSKMPSEINLNLILLITASSLLITIIATIFPALAAAKLDPIKALKYE